jgi:hypothetical protein
VTDCLYVADGFNDNGIASFSTGDSMNLAKILVAAALVAVTLPAQAAGVGLRAGTTGVGADIGWSLAPTLSARVGYSAFSYSHHLSPTDVRYDAKLKLSNLSALLDFSPLGPFRLTGGVIANDNKYSLAGTGSSYRINGHTYSASEVGLSGTVKSGRSLAPYLGIGYGNVAGAGVNFYFDLGIMFMGSPKASLAASCGGSANCAQLRNDLNREQARIQDDLRAFKYYPVANIGLTIGF